MAISRKKSSLHHIADAFDRNSKLLQDFKALRNPQRLQQVFQNVPIVLTGETIKTPGSDSDSYFVYFSAHNAITSSTAADMDLAIECVIFFLSLISGMPKDSVVMFGYIDCQQDALDVFSAKISALYQNRANFSHLRILEPERRISEVVMKKEDPKAIVESFDWQKLSRTKTSIYMTNYKGFREKSIDKHHTCVPLVFGGQRAYDSRIWMRSFTVFIQYLQKILDLHLDLKNHHSRFHEIWQIENSDKLKKALEHKDIREKSAEIFFKISGMLENRQSVILFFSKKEFQDQSTIFFNLVASRIVGMCENLNAIYEDLMNANQKHLNSINDLENLDEFLAVHVKLIDEKIKEVRNHAYSLGNLGFWMKKIDENVQCEIVIIDKMKNEMKSRMTKSDIDSDVFLEKCEKLKQKMDEYALTIDKQTEMLHERLQLVYAATEFCLEQLRKVDDLKKIDNFGDLLALLDQDIISLSSQLEQCENIPRHTHKILRSIFHRIQLIKKNPKILAIVEEFRRNIEETAQIQGNNVNKANDDNNNNNNVNGNKLMLLLQPHQSNIGNAQNESKSLKLKPNNHNDGKDVSDETSNEDDDYDDEDSNRFDYDSRSSLDDIVEETKREMKEKEAFKRRNRKKTKNSKNGYSKESKARRGSKDSNDYDHDSDGHIESLSDEKSDIEIFGKNRKGKKRRNDSSYDSIDDDDDDHGKYYNRGYSKRKKGYNNNNLNNFNRRHNRNNFTNNNYNYDNANNNRNVNKASNEYELARQLPKDGGVLMTHRVMMDKQGMHVMNQKITRKGKMMVTETERIRISGKSSETQNNGNNDRFNRNNMVNNGRNNNIGVFFASNNNAHYRSNINSRSSSSGSNNNLRALAAVIGSMLVRPRNMSSSNSNNRNSNNETKRIMGQLNEPDKPPIIDEYE